MMENAASTRHHAEKQKHNDQEAKADTERFAKDARDMDNEKRKGDRLKEERLQTQTYLFEQMRKKHEGKDKEMEQKKTKSENG